MPYVESKITIKGEGTKIYEIIKDMASYPNFMKDLVSVEILERGEDYTVSHWVSNVDGRKIVWTERDTFYPANLKITYAQTDGDLKKMEGAWTIIGIPNSKSTARVTSQSSPCSSIVQAPSIFFKSPSV